MPSIKVFLLPMKHVVMTMVVVMLYSIPMGGIRAAVSDSTDLISMKNTLQQQLDSIDLEKQIRKRKGIPLEDLEKAALVLKDSISLLRMRIESLGQAAVESRFKGLPDTSSHVAGIIQKWLPRNLFDWVLLIVGAVAMVAGVILCIGIISLVRRKIKPKQRRGPETHTRGGSPFTDSAIGHTSALEALKSQIAERTIDSLRKRVSEDKEIAVEGSIDSGTVKQADGPQCPADSADNKKNIVEAASQGASVAEISRRFHVSADQVSLIIRIAQRSNEDRV